MCANVCAGFICCCYGACWVWYILGILVAPWSLVHMGGAGFAGGGVPIAGHAHRVEVGGGILCVTLGELSGLHHVVPLITFWVMGVIPWLWSHIFLLALVRLPSLHGYYAAWYVGLRVHYGEIAGEIYVRPLFLVFCFFCVVPVWHLWIGRARHPGPGAVSFAVEVFNVGGWLTQEIWS